MQPLTVFVCVALQLELLRKCVSLTYLSVLQARGEDQDPGEKGQRPDRRELHGAECGSPTAGQCICLRITKILGG